MANSAQTDIEIIAYAAALIGRNDITTIAGAGKFGEAAENFYGTLVEAELGSLKWRFALNFQTVSSVSTLDPNFDGWKYYWELPADLLMLHYLTPFISYRRLGTRILTSSNQQFTAIYNRNVPVNEWPNPFKMFIAYKLADLFSISITLSDRILARIRNGITDWENKARFADSQQEQGTTIRYNPYLSVRQ
jgi:hypothetical protein